MYHAPLNRLMATVILCSLCLQGCQSSFQITSEDPILEKSRKANDDEQATNQVRVPDVQCSVLSDVRNSRLSIVASVILPSVATPTAQVASPMHHPAVTPDAVPSRRQAPSAALEETDAKSAVRPIAQAARFSSKQPLNHWGTRPKYPRTENFPLKSSPRARRKTSEQTCEVRTVGNELPRQKDLNVLKRKMRALTQARILAEAFGAEAWSQYFGEVGAEPCLPPDIAEILDNACPFWPSKSVRDTHLLVLIPSTVGGKAFTLDLLGDLIQNPRSGGHRTQYFLYDDEVQQSLGDAYSSSSYWILLTRDVLPGSRSKPYTAQRALVATQTSYIDGPPYETPHVLEAATAILSHYVRSAHRLYEGVGDKLSSTSTCCAELLEDATGCKSPVTVGRFCDRGLVFLSGFDDDAESGVSCLRRFGIRNYRPSALLHSFGVEEWSRYFGEVASAPPLPAHIVDTLNSPCPFWPGKAVKDTHLLVLIPATVAGKPFSLNLLGELIECPRGGGYSTGYRFYDSDVQAAIGTQSPASSYWVLMTYDVLGGSRGKKYASQKALVAARVGEIGLPYELPSALETVAVVLACYVRSAERLYVDMPLTYTRCKDLVDNQHSVVVGGFSSGGLCISLSYGDSKIGVAILRKL